MKKLFTLIAFSTIMIACGNSSEPDTTTTPAAVDSDTAGKTIPPPITLDTNTVQSDTARVKKAMKK